MERRTKDPSPNPAAGDTARPHGSRRRRALGALAAAVVSCGLAGSVLAQPAAQAMKSEAGDRPQSRAGSGTGPAAKAPGGAPRGDWTRHFTPEERDAWQQKIAAASDEAERRKLRGQRLAEIQRRTRAQKAEGAPQASARPVRQASPEAATAAQRPR